MRLDFVWIEDYKALKNKEFNFNPNLHYHFDKETSKLSHSIDKTVPNDFFQINKDTVIGVSAIVGANGTGKSTLLEFICRFLTTHRPLGGIIITDKYIINKSDYDVKLFSRDKQDLQFLNRIDLIRHYQRGNNNFSINDDRNHVMGLKVLQNLIMDTQLISYTGQLNFYDTNRVWETMLSLPHEYENSHYTDISDMSFVVKDQETYRTDNGIYSGENVILTHRSGEAKRFINLMLSDSKNTIPFPIQHLQVSFAFNDISENFFQSYDEMGFMPMLSFILNEIKNTNFELNETDLQFFNEISDYGLFHFFDNKFRKTKKTPFSDLFHHFFLLRYVREQFARALGEHGEKNKISHFISIIQEINVAFSNDKSYKKQIIDYLKQAKVEVPQIGSVRISAINKLIANLPTDDSWNDQPIFLSATNQNLKKIFDSLDEFDRRSGLRYSIYSLFDFGLHGLSTGEKQFLKIFSRFVSMRLDNKNLKEKFLLILIDEFDVGFHPLWQRQFLTTWIEFLEKFVNKSKRNKISIQLIFTSHSPFIVSDLPKQCISFLSRTKDKSHVEVDPLNEHSETLGANIHELYSDTFFLEGALMGDFAKRKIQHVIDELNSKESLKNPENLKLLIQRIGEPIIQTKLFEKLAERLNKNPEISRLRAQREYINRRLKELEKDDSN